MKCDGTVSKSFFNLDYKAFNNLSVSHQNPLVKRPMTEYVVILKEGYVLSTKSRKQSPVLPEWSQEDLRARVIWKLCILQEVSNEEDTMWGRNAKWLKSPSSGPWEDESRSSLEGMDVTTRKGTADGFRSQAGRKGSVIPR